MSIFVEHKMRFVLIQSIMQTTKRWRKKLHINLQPPEAGDSQPKRKDRTGLIFFLLAITLVLTAMYLA
jgi:hypothetical protein